MSIPYWRLSGFYYCYFATLGGLLPFWSLYLKARGFDAAAIGELSALLVGTKIIAPNLGGWIADRTGKSLKIIRLALFLSTLCFFSFLSVRTYLEFAIVTVVFSFFWNAALPQFEAVTLQFIQTEPLRYARIRLWGSIGFIAAVLGIGRLLDFQNIASLPYLLGALLLLTSLVTLSIPEGPPFQRQSHEASIWQIVLSSKVLAFLLVYLLLQMAHSPYYVFYSIYLKQHQYSSSLIGLLWALGVMAEIVLFILIKPVLKYINIRHLLLLSILLSGIRWTLIARYPEYLWLMIFAQLLHAASFGSLHVVAMQLIQHYFGSKHQGKGQALYSSVSFGLGGVFGGYYSGYLWTLLGPEALFLLAAACCGMALIIALIWVRR